MNAKKCSDAMFTCIILTMSKTKHKLLKACPCRHEKYFFLKFTSYLKFYNFYLSSVKYTVYIVGCSSSLVIALLHYSNFWISELHDNVSRNWHIKKKITKYQDIFGCFRSRPAVTVLFYLSVHTCFIYRVEVVCR